MTSAFDCREYWDTRYRSGGTSGEGSEGRLAAFKAETINRFVSENNIGSVIELGCGDGQQLERMQFTDYTGLDVSPEAIRRCREKFAHQPRFSFYHIDEYKFARPAEATLSLDVIFHLTDDDAYQKYMSQLFAYAGKFVIIYSSNKNQWHPAPHVRHRRFTDWVERNATGWQLKETIRNPYPWRPWSRRATSFCDFYIFENDQDA